MTKQEKSLLSLCQALCAHKKAISERLGNEFDNLSFDNTGMSFYTKQDFGHPQDGNLWALDFYDGTITIEHNYSYLDEEGDHGILHQKLTITDEDTTLKNIKCQHCEYSSSAKIVNSMMKEMEHFINDNNLKSILTTSSSSFFPSESKTPRGPSAPSVDIEKGYKS